MATFRTCDGVVRRDFIKVGALAGLGLSLPEYLRRAAAGEVADAKGKSAIFVNLNGGPTHMDTFDLKPESPEEFRGEFKPIKTNVEGIEISEFPDLGQRYGVQAVPLTVINDKVAVPGMLPEEQFVDLVVKTAQGSEAATPRAAGPTNAVEPPPAPRVERGKERPSGLYIP